MRTEHFTFNIIKVLLSSVVSIFFVCSVLVSDSSAIDLTYDVEHIYGGYESTFSGTATTFSGATQCISPVNVKLWSCAGGNLTSMYITIPNRQYVNGDWITIEFSSNLGRNNTANHSQFLGFKYGGNHPIDVIQLKVEQFSDNSQFATLYLRVHGTFTDSNLYFNGGASVGSPIVQLYGNGENTPGITLLTTNVYHETAGKDYSSTLNSINNNISSSNSKLDSVNNNLQDLQETQEQANDDANARYEDEKDTINQNGDDAVDSWDDAQENLSFNAPTFLFGWLWSLGSVEDCVDISTLASLIHSPETQYCTWYPTSIRSIISPIINIFLVCLISGFVFSWLKKGGV